MEENLAIIEKLCDLKQRSFRIDELEKLGIHHDERDDLVRKKLLNVDNTNPFPDWIYFVSDSAYGLVQNKKIAENGVAYAKTGIMWQKIGIGLAWFSLAIALIALGIAILAYLRP